MIRPDTRVAIVTLAERLRVSGVSSEDWVDIIFDELVNTPLDTSAQDIEQVLKDLKAINKVLDEQGLAARSPHWNPDDPHGYRPIINKL